MEKIVRIGKISDQDNFRRADISRITKDERVMALLEMQANYLRWDLNPRIERVGKLKRIGFKDVSKTD